MILNLLRIMVCLLVLLALWVLRPGQGRSIDPKKEQERIKEIQARLGRKPISEEEITDSAYAARVLGPGKSTIYKRR